MTVVALSLAAAARAVAIEMSAPQHRGNRAVRHGPCGPAVPVAAIFRTLRCPGGDALQTTLLGAPSGPFLEMPTRNRLPCGLDAGFRHRWTDVGFGP